MNTLKNIEKIFTVDDKRGQCCNVPPETVCCTMRQCQTALREQCSAYSEQRIAHFELRCAPYFIPCCNAHCNHYSHTTVFLSENVLI